MNSSSRFKSTELFYKDIINKIIEQSREDFINEGFNEDVIIELKKVAPLI